MYNEILRLYSWCVANKIKVEGIDQILEYHKTGQRDYLNFGDILSSTTIATVCDANVQNNKTW